VSENKRNEKRKRFLSEITESILLPYEASEVYEEDIVGEFENQYEKEYFNTFFAEIREKDLILDLACGNGRHTVQLSKKANYLVALDFSSNNLSMAKKKCHGNRNIAFIKGSMLVLPFRKNMFNGVWFSQAFEYVPPDEREPFLMSVKRVLKPKGILYMSVETWMNPSPWSSFIEFLGDFRLFFYWKFIKRKPLLWGEFLYYLRAEDIRARCSGWHYHVHTDKWTLRKLLRRLTFEIFNLDIYGGYIYTLCRRGFSMKIQCDLIGSGTSVSGYSPRSTNPTER
jgi:ubiquinone/menaquinone biosynthesis C-methylase UbiE